MQKLQIFVYKSEDERCVGLLRNPRHAGDLVPDPGRMLIVTPPLASSHAYESLDIWKNRFRRGWGSLWWHVAARQTQHGRLVCQMTLSQDKERIFEVLDRLKEILYGRILSEHKLFSVLRQEGFWPSDISRGLDLGVHKADLSQLPGFMTASWGRKVCTRCQSEDVRVIPCLVCGRADCLLCAACSSMGQHRSCSTLLAVAGHKQAAPADPVELVLGYGLTTAQKWASEQLLQFWKEDQSKALVWAACGAGKTEVTYPLIRQVLSEGGEVLFAIPRQDIVREMAGRLRQSFPGVTVAAHYSGQPWLAEGHLVVATTHQVLRFYRRFQLAILDEVDAFPYQGNEMLRFGLQRALMPRGRLVEMTATPHSRRDYERVITIPARYHGFPLPEPELIVHKLPPWSEAKAADLPPVVLSSLGSKRGPWLVFAPTIEASSSLQKLLAKALGKPVGLCHSKVVNRSETIRDLRVGDLDIVVTTSVLERGVNFPGVGVLVLYADHAVFSARALVQIAGRVGRTADFPGGAVLFIGAKLTAPMNEAQKLIKQLNEQAKERGLLHGEDTA